MKKIIQSLFAATAILGSSFAAAELAVIVNPATDVASLSSKDVTRLFMGKATSLPSGAAVTVVHQQEDAAAYAEFLQKVCKKSPSQYKAYWAQLRFTGKARAPLVAGDSEAIMTLVANNPGMLGYVDAALVDESVKVVLLVP